MAMCEHVQAAIAKAWRYFNISNILHESNRKMCTVETIFIKTSIYVEVSLPTQI